MKNQKNSDYFVSLDIGTNSVGYAVTDKDYNLMKYQQHPMWGVHLFDEAQLAQERRTHRASRRRLDRRQQRVQLLRELFALQIGMVDKYFFERIDRSSCKKSSDELPYAIFADSDYTDRNFYRQYPTIHHLIAELIDSNQPHDIRLVYLACAWLVVHRGHFFSDVAKERIDEITNFTAVYQEMEDFLAEQGYTFSWKNSNVDINHIGNILKSAKSRTAKHTELAEYLHVKEKKKKDDNEAQLNEDEFLALLSGKERTAAKLFPNGDYSTELKLNLDAEDEKISEMLAGLSENDATLLLLMKNAFDWSSLADIISDSKNISQAKVKIYEKHRADLKQLKYLVRKYLTAQYYKEIFRGDVSKDKKSYTSYSQKKINREDFYKFLKGKLKKIQTVDLGDSAALEQINCDIEAENFLLKQVVSDNRTIPYQLYWNELNKLLANAAGYLPFLDAKDTDGLSVREKILSLMEFRIPYFVGPLNSHSKFAWICRKAEGRILPWNFDRKVDLDACEKEFIRRMTNKCTYLPGEDVLPKQSLLYQQFEVLNQLNNIHIDGKAISVDCKQKLYSLFAKTSKVSKKTILNFLKANNLYHDIDENSITGIDEIITASLSSYKAFKPFVDSKKLTYQEIEEIISQRTCMEEQSRFASYLKKFSQLTAEDIKTLCRKRFQGFGRLSRKFLTEAVFKDPQTGNQLSVISMMWEDNINLQQLLSDKYPLIKFVEKYRKEFYATSQNDSLLKQLDDMYISNAVKRPIIRAFKVLEEIVQVRGSAPQKIFIEMARGAKEEQKNKRTISRLKQIQDLYRDIADEDTRRLAEELKNYDDSALQKDTLYLYFMQLGKDMYTGDPIDISKLSLYDKEHIYPRSKVKDDSILNNLVLVHSEVNGAKKDIYPLDSDTRTGRAAFWKYLLAKKLIRPEKYFRLTRSTPFTDDEKWGFINRQLVETQQATKVIAALLQERYPDSKIVYVKAGLVSEFRHKFEFIKSRTVNDLHHGKDAYLNIVVGNVWDECFTRQWFTDNTENYSIKAETVFGEKSIRKNYRGAICWNGREHLPLVRKIMQRNYLHLTSYSYCQHGGFFDQNPIAAKSGLIPLKKDKPTEIYGGYNKSTAAFFALALTEEAGTKSHKKELTLVPVDLLVAERFLHDEAFAVEYINNFKDTSGKKKFNVQFPLGLKPIKIKTVFEVDNGLRFRLNGKSGGGSQLLISLFTPLQLDTDWEKYIKHLESFCEKKRKNPQHIYSEFYDKFSCKKILNFMMYW